MIRKVLIRGRLGGYRYRRWCGEGSRTEILEDAVLLTLKTELGATSRGKLVPSKSWKSWRSRFSPRIPKGMQPCPPISGLLTSGTPENKSVLFQTIVFVIFATTASGSRTGWTERSFLPSPCMMPSIPPLKCCCCSLVTKPCPTLCDPMDWSPPGSSVHEISQARILKWVAIFSSRGSSRPRDRTCVSCTASRFFYHWTTWEFPAPQIKLNSIREPTTLSLDSLAESNTWAAEMGQFYYVWSWRYKAEEARTPLWQNMGAQCPHEVWAQGNYPERG